MSFSDGIHQTSTVSILADLNLVLADCIAKGIMHSGTKYCFSEIHVFNLIKVYLPEVHTTLDTDQNAFKTERVWLIHGEVHHRTLPRIIEGYYCLNALEVY